MLPILSLNFMYSSTSQLFHVFEYHVLVCVLHCVCMFVFMYVFVFYLCDSCIFLMQGPNVKQHLHLLIGLPWVNMF